MVRLKLSYFDFHGGRGEPARLALYMNGIAFEDHRIPLADWPDARQQTPLGRVPVLEVDGQQLTQSNTINRYVGRLTGLYPNDDWQATLCDEVMDTIEDLTAIIIATFEITDEDEKRIAREKICKGPLRTYLIRLQANLDERGGTYFSDNRLTMADLKVFVWLRHLLSGKIDYIPTDTLDQVAPQLLEFYARINNEPKISEYYRQ